MRLTPFQERTLSFYRLVNSHPPPPFSDLADSLWHGGSRSVALASIPRRHLSWGCVPLVKGTSSINRNSSLTSKL
jgi:hypothetical protein